jgi:hypothetical protein
MLPVGAATSAKRAMPVLVVASSFFVAVRGAKRCGTRPSATGCRSATRCRLPGVNAPATRRDPAAQRLG